VIRRLFSRGKKASEATAPENAELPAGFRAPVSTDLHSHLIPGIDDGVSTVEESLGLMRGMYDLGYRRLIVTPHVMGDSYRNSTDAILQGLELMREALERNGTDMRIEAAAEYYMDEELQKRLRSGDILTVGDECLLFETSYYTEPLNLEETVYEISARGYRPILAHPERYRYVNDPEEKYARLRELGTLFQVNINSLGGYYGREARRKAFWLMEKGWIDFLGSDLHGAGQLEQLRRTFAAAMPSELFGRNDVLNDTIN